MLKLDGREPDGPTNSKAVLLLCWGSGNSVKGGIADFGKVGIVVALFSGVTNSAHFMINAKVFKL